MYNQEYFTKIQNEALPLFAKLQVIFNIDAERYMFVGYLHRITPENITIGYSNEVTMTISVNNIMDVKLLN